MRQQADIPCVVNEPGRGSDREIPIGWYTENASSVDENRVHVPEDVQREVGPRRDLKCPMEALRGGTPTPCQKQAGADLEKHGRDQQRFTHARAVDNASDVHDGRMCVGADQPKQVIG